MPNADSHIGLLALCTSEEAGTEGGCQWVDDPVLVDRGV
jgi:hypothetical protein